MRPVPASRLLWTTFALAVASAIAGPLPEIQIFAWVLIGLGALVAGIDLCFSLGRSGAVQVALPPIVRLTKDRAGHVDVVFTPASSTAQRIRFGLALPAVFESENQDAWVELPTGSKQARIAWATTPKRRGRYEGVRTCIETTSPLGFWLLRRLQTHRCELRVYPNLFSERKALAALFLSRGQFGAKLQRTVGRGREFEKLREYLPGDGFDEIHWKATAKRGHPVTKVFQAERTQEIYVVIDASRLSGRSVKHHGITQTALERYITASLVLLLAAERNGDRFGLIAYDDWVRVHVKAGQGDSHYAHCRDAIYGLQPSESTPDMGEVVRHLRMQIRRRALLFILTDLTDPVLAEDFCRHTSLLARQHLVMVNQLRAPEVAPVFAGSEIEEPQEMYARLAGHARWSEAQTLIRTLKPTGVSAHLLEDETLAASLVTQYLTAKQRQIL